jgi:hypothetical protein
MVNGQGQALAPEQIAWRFVHEHRQRLPDLLQRVIIVGSAALGDWKQGRSDVDLVMVVDRRLAMEDLTVAARLHAETKSSRPVDGIYLTEQQLIDGPEVVLTAPQVVDGQPTAEQRGGELSWVTWREVELGIETEVAADGGASWAPSDRRYPEALEGARRFSRDNLTRYWAPLGVESRTRLTALPADAEVTPRTVEWIALGPARLLATIETGAIISKSGAAEFAAVRWPEYADVVGRASSSRAGADVVFTATDAAGALDLLDRCVAAADADLRD